MKQDRNILAQHGTKIMSLPPSAILAAAKADIERVTRNQQRAKDGLGYEPYAFHRKHVKRSASAAELVSRAAAEPGLGAQSSKYNTRLIYGDTELLRAAVNLANGV